MTDCPNGDVRDLLPDLVHDRLAPDARRDVEAHVRSCLDCQQELGLLRGMRATLRRAPSVDVAAIVAAIPAYRAPVRRSWGGWRAAAAIMILAAGGTSVAVLGRGGNGVADSMPESASVAAPVASVPSAAAPLELATGGGIIGELTDRELSALLKDLETLEVLPSAEVENGATVSPIAPTGTN